MSLMLAMPDAGEKDPQQLARLTLTGEATELSADSAEEASAKEIYLAKFPHMAGIVEQLGDFSFWAVRPKSARFVGGFARAFTLDARRAPQGDRRGGGGVVTIPSLVTRDVVPILQVAVGPVILISGVGLLLLSMTNRFGRLIDRSRQLAHELRTAGEEERVGLVAQVRILTARAQIVRLAIALAATSILLASLLIILLFLAALLGLDVAVLLSLVFIACMACLIASLVLFLRDINFSLHAFKLEIEAAARHRP